MIGSSDFPFCNGSLAPRNENAFASVEWKPVRWTQDAAGMSGSLRIRGIPTIVSVVDSIDEHEYDNRNYEKLKA